MQDPNLDAHFLPLRELVTIPPPDPADRTRAAALRSRGAALLGLVLLGVLLLLGMCARAGEGLRGMLPGRVRTTVSHDLVVQQVRSVAQLVTSETRVRDVVTYQSTWMGSTKRALIVASGRILAGPDLDSTSGADVQVDDVARRITVTLPPARVLSIEVTDVKTYDERGGLWNPFRPEDRDEINRRVRNQLARAALEMGVVEHANRSAVLLLQRLLAREGYTVDVRVRSGLTTAPAG